MKPKISAVCCTYGRFSCVERVMNCFLSQTYPNKELIIYNTELTTPYLQEFNDELLKMGIIIVNCNTDVETNSAYTNVGAIRRDALTFATGDYVVTWDDDDIFLPFFMEQAVDRMNYTKLPSFKPEKSFFYSGNYLRLVKNTLEASVVARIDKVREYGYLLETGKEGLGWYTKLRDNRELDENDSDSVPSYCFNWNDGQEMKAPHKQSGDIDNPNNFNNHKEASIDYVNGRSLEIWDIHRVNKMFVPYYSYLIHEEHGLDRNLINKYL
jgi:glycosyltransferase involved in cell wall biosynthesis